MAVMEKIKPFYDAVYKFVMLICKLLLLADILITCWSILGRRINFIGAPKWGEEIILTLMAYMAVLAASLALRRNAHIRMTAFDNYLPKPLLRTLDLLADIGIIAFSLIMLIVGMKFCLATKGFYMSLPWLPTFWKYFPIPLAGFFMLIFELDTFYEHIKICFAKEEK